MERITPLSALMQRFLVERAKVLERASGFVQRQGRCSDVRADVRLRLDE